jgi:hypothetical protein
MSDRLRGGVHKGDASGWLHPNKLRVAAHDHGLRLTNVELPPSGFAERLDRLVEKGSHPGHIRCMEGGVICVLMVNGNKGPADPLGAGCC